MARQPKIKRVEVRGWIEICKLLDVKNWRTARSKLEKLGMLVYEDTRPVLNIEAYNLVSMRRHLKKRV
jgi:hypothetical protein